jgi:hypothetical protein
MSRIDTFPDSEENPLKFSYDTSSAIPTIFPETGYAIRNIVKRPQVGDVLLMMNVRIILRTHNGTRSCLDCDGDDRPEYISKKETMLAVYFNIPDEFLGLDGNIDDNLLDEEIHIIESEITHCIFKGWTLHSDCGWDSGYCDLYDTYIPISVEYVVIC